MEQYAENPGGATMNVQEGTRRLGTLPGVLGFTLLSVLLIGCGDRPYFLTRDTAKSAIEKSADFLWKTKLTFATGEQPLYPIGATSALELTGRLLNSSRRNESSGWGQCKNTDDIRCQITDCSSCYRNWLTEEGEKTVEEYERKGLLTKERNPLGRSGRRLADYVIYHVIAGVPVVQVTGILKDGHNATVEFDWRFESVNRFGEIVNVANGGSTGNKATFVEYDDGWRITKIVAAWLYGDDRIY
jgi:hypothetical protein